MKLSGLCPLYGCNDDSTDNQLKRFQRNTLNPGESKVLTFKIPASEFSFYDTGINNLKTAKGRWELQVGSSSKDTRLKEVFTIE
jgi:beta-glucosidase